jgi:hypothetical protein
MRYRLPVLQPTTSKKFIASNCARCSVDSQCRKRRVALASAVFPADRSVKSPERAGTRRIGRPVKKAQQKIHRYRLAADEAREKQGLFGAWVKRAYSDGFTRRSSDRGRKPRSSQFLEALFGFRQRPNVTRVELVPAVTAVIHHNLGRHGKLLCNSPFFSSKLHAVRTISWIQIIGPGRPTTRTSFTASEAEIKQRIEALRSAGYMQFTIQLVPGHEHALADWARIRKALVVLRRKDSWQEQRL